MRKIKIEIWEDGDVWVYDDRREFIITSMMKNLLKDPAEKRRFWKFVKEVAKETFGGKHGEHQ